MNSMKAIRLLSGWVCALLLLPGMALASADSLLAQQYPALAALYAKYPRYHAQLSDFAISQGFADPVENLATVVHELIHIDSAAHQGFFIDGTYYAPYLTVNAWPSVTNKEIENRLTDTDRAVMGPVYFGYLNNTPKNTLGNVLDEINAYTQTIPFICANSPQTATRHLNILAGHLAMADSYLRILAARYPDQYRTLSTNKTSRGALETIIANAYTTLNICYRMGITAADPRPIPKASTSTFAAQSKPR
jgi:hypothetical protein